MALTLDIKPDRDLKPWNDSRVCYCPRCNNAINGTVGQLRRCNVCALELTMPDIVARHTPPPVTPVPLRFRCGLFLGVCVGFLLGLSLAVAGVELVAHPGTKLILQFQRPAKDAVQVEKGE